MVLRQHIKVGMCQNLVEQQYRMNDIAMKEKLSFTADWRFVENINLPYV